MKIVTFVFMFLGGVIAALGQGAQSMVVEVTNIAALKARNVLALQTTVAVRGYVTAGDGGGGVFEYHPSSSTAQDGGIVIAPNVGSGRWIRKIDGRDYMARWWGPTKTNITLQSAMNWVSSNGWGRVIADGGRWIVKSDNSTRLLMQSGVTLITDEDSQIECAPNPVDNWILIDFPIGASDCGVGPARLLGWNLLPPGGDTNKSGLIFSLQDTTNVVIGGIKADNWYTQYADVGSGNANLKMFDDNWKSGVRAFGAKGDGVRIDTKAGQSFTYYCERYGEENFWPPTTNGYLISTIFASNGIPVKFRGEKTIIKSFYYNPDEGVVPRYSAAFNITANNCAVEGFDFRTVGSYPVTETNTAVTGFFIPVIVHMATNTLIRNNTFTVETGKGIFLSGASYAKVHDNTFNDCGLSTGNGHQPDWLWYEAAVPIKGGPSRSPIGCSFERNIFNRGSPYKHVLFLSAADDFIVRGNYFVNQNTPIGPLIVYSGDEGTTDQYGTNVYKVSGLIKDNFISGTNFGVDAAIWVRINTPTNFVPSTFNPSNMYSAITIEGNKVYGVGRGIEILSAPGTTIRDNDIRVSSNPIYHVGNVNDLLVDGGWYESTNASTGSTFHFADGYLQPAQFKRVTYRNATLVSPAGDECMFRNVEPLFVDSLTIQDCVLRFNGAAGAGDYPQLFQWTAGTNFINFSRNKIHFGPSMSARRVGLSLNTNSNFTFDDNQLIVTTASVIRRGPYFRDRKVFAQGNDVGSFELQYVGEGLLQHNLFTSATNTFVALEIHDSGYVSVIKNNIENLHSFSTLAASIGATNSIVAKNIIKGNSASDLLRVISGKMYEEDNIIINPGGGSLYASASGSGRIAHSILERPVLVEIGTSTDYPLTLTRGVIPYGHWKFGMNEVFANSHRDVRYEIWPTDTNYWAGHAFFVHNLNDLTNTTVFGFGMNGPRQFFVGSTNGGETVNITGSGNVQLLHTNSSDAYFITSNSVASVRYGQVASNGQITTSDPFGAVHMQFGGVQTFQFSTNSLTPLVDDAVYAGSAAQRYKSIFTKSVEFSGTVRIIPGTGSPEGVVAGSPGCLYLRIDGGAGTSFYVKESGTGTTGWVGK